MSAVGTKITLAHPVTVGSEVIREVTLRAPNFGDLMDLDSSQSSAQQGADLICTLSGLLPPVVRLFSIEDTTTLLGVVADMMGKSRATGRKSRVN